jgi:hypothetical protein
MLTSLCAIALFLFATLVIVRDELRATRATPRASHNAEQALRAIGGMYSHANIRNATRTPRESRPLRSEHAANTSMRGHQVYRATVKAMHASNRP